MSYNVRPTGKRTLTDLEKIVQDLAVRAEREAADSKIEALTRLLSALYDRAAAYTNLIIIAGYAAFFTVWGIMKETMSQREMLAAALAASFSLLVFVTWEVTKMIITSRSLRGLSRALDVPHDQLDAALEAQRRIEEKTNVRIFRSWYIILVLTVAPGIIAGGVLFYSFIRQLLTSA